MDSFKEIQPIRKARSSERDESLPKQRWGHQYTLAIAGLASLTVIYSVMVAPREFVRWSADEDGLFETASAVGFGLAGVVLFLILIRRRRVKVNHRRSVASVYLLALGLLFLFGAGEEISWGQRLFAFQPLERVADANVQSETNIHNLDFFHQQTADGKAKQGWAAFVTIERLFAMFWFGFCVAVPVVHQSSDWCRNVLDRLRFPVVSIGLGVLFAVNHVIFKVFERILLTSREAELLSPAEIDIQLIWPLAEIKEFGFSALFLMVAIDFSGRELATGPNQAD